MRTTNKIILNANIQDISSVLSGLSRDRLRTLAKQHGIPTARYKQDMIQRILQSDIEVSISIS